MELLLSLLSLSALVVASTFLQKYFSKIPLPLFQIGLGAIWSWLPLHHNTLEFKPEAFMVCLIAPLLFADGWGISRRDLWQYRKPMLLMSFGLVIFTVIGIGYFIHFLIPSMPLAVAFTLAAILSPTDAVAVKSMTHGRKFPNGLMAILEGESLLNDAAGLVSFKVALGVVMTGVFSAGSATWQFFLVSLGGLVAGYILGVLLVGFRIFLRKKGLENIQSFVTIQLMTPFVIFIVAEKLGVSGVLAVVMAGIVHGIESERLQQHTTKLQIISNSTFSVLSYILNGFVFVLLGFLLPDVVVGLLESGETFFLKAVGLTLSISLALYGARYLWVFMLYKRFVPNANGPEHTPSARRKYAFTSSISGVHGTITLATALSIPFELMNGEQFPLRNTILFISASVILISLLVATFVIPLLAKRMKEQEEDADQMTMKEARNHIGYKALHVLSSDEQPGNREGTAVVIKQLLDQIRFSGGKLSSSLIHEYERIGKEAETERLSEIVRQGFISSQLQAVFPMLVKPHDTAGLGNKLTYMRFRMKLDKVYEKIQHHHWDNLPKFMRNAPDLVEEVKSIKKQMQSAAVAAIQKETTKEHKLESLLVIQQYARILNWKLDEESEAEFLNQLRHIQLRSVQIKRDTIQHLVETNKISTETMLELLQVVNYEETMFLHNRKH